MLNQSKQLNIIFLEAQIGIVNDDSIILLDFYFYFSIVWGCHFGDHPYRDFPMLCK
jgi:hypothetical protein